MRALLTCYLRDAGYNELLTAISAYDAFNVLGLENPLQEPGVDLILMDITMPGIDGIEACRRITASPVVGEIPIIMVTAHDESKYLEAAFEAGAVDYVTKSAKRFELQAKVKLHIGGGLVVYAESDLMEIIPRFLDNRRDDITKIAGAVEEGDYKAIWILGHDMKGCGGGYGFDGITDIGQALEQAAEDQDQTEIRKLVQELVSYVGHVEVVYE